MKWPKAVTIAVLCSVSICSCHKADHKVYSDINLHPTNRKGSIASKQTIEGLLYEIWDSGFIRKNELTQQEILNNAYGVFRKAPETLSDPEGRAYYQRREGKKDLLMLNVRLFGHLEPVPKLPHMDKVRVKRLDEGIRATVVHELFHDFWHNILDGRKRYLFSEEAELFFVELMLSRTESQKQQVLDDIGSGLLEALDYESFEVLLEIQDIYNVEKTGTELFAVLASRAFSGDAIIPLRLRKYYTALVSDGGLHKNRLSKSPGSIQSEKSPQTQNFEILDVNKKSSGAHPDLINARDNNGFTPLHHAAYTGNEGAVRLLLTKGADPEAKAATCDWTPFFLAVFKGNLATMEELLKAGNSIDEKDRRGRSALHIAARQGHKNLIGSLLEHGAGIHSEDVMGMTPLHLAALCGRRDSASLLLAVGANAKSKDHSGQTPLHLASFCGSKKLAELLIAEGAAIDEPDNRGETALHIAAFCGNQEVVELLIERGAEPGIKNTFGEIPGEIASKAGHEKIVNILRRAAY